MQHVWSCIVNPIQTLFKKHGGKKDSKDSEECSQVSLLSKQVYCLIGWGLAYQIKRSGSFDSWTLVVDRSANEWTYGVVKMTSIGHRYRRYWAEITMGKLRLTAFCGPDHPRANKPAVLSQKNAHITGARTHPCGPPCKRLTPLQIWQKWSG